jgi:hypothetical protein
MATIGFQSSSFLFVERNGSSGFSGSSFSANGRGSFQQAFSGLVSAIKSGDSTDAASYLARVEQRTPSDANSSSPVSVFLASVSTALSNNDIAAAQTALTTFESSFRNRPAPPAPTAPAASGATGTTGATGTAAGSGTSSESGISPLGQDLLNLFSAVGSGNLSDAQSAYDSLTSLLFSSANTSSSATTAASSDTSSSSAYTSFLQLLSEIGSALSSSKIGSAQTALGNFLTSISSGSLVNATA